MKKLSRLNMKTLSPVILLGLLGCVSTGCGTSSLSDVKVVPEVSGTVLLPTGRPLKGGQILLYVHSVECKGAGRLSADINKDGTFKIQKVIIKNKK